MPDTFAVGSIALENQDKPMVIVCRSPQTLIVAVGASVDLWSDQKEWDKKEGKYPVLLMVILACGAVYLDQHDDIIFHNFIIIVSFNVIINYYFSTLIVKIALCPSNI